MSEGSLTYVNLPEEISIASFSPATYFGPAPAGPFLSGPQMEKRGPGGPRFPIAPTNRTRLLQFDLSTPVLRLPHAARGRNAKVGLPESVRAERGRIDAKGPTALPAGLCTP